MTAASDHFEDISVVLVMLSSEELRCPLHPLRDDQAVFPSLGRVVFTENTKNLTMVELPLKMQTICSTAMLNKGGRLHQRSGSGAADDSA